MTKYLTNKNNFVNLFTMCYKLGLDYLQQGLVFFTSSSSPYPMNRQISNISHTLVGNKIVYRSDVVGASPVGAAPTSFSFWTWHLASIYWAKQLQDETRDI